MPVRLAALLALVLVSGCDSLSNGEAQRAFDDAAFFSPSDGPTDDDWRVGPLFGVRVQVTQPAAPNPAAPGDVVSVQVYADEAAGGFGLYRRLPGGAVERVQFRAGATGPNIYTFTFFASEAASGQSGSVRLLVLDAVERVVTYGDLVVEG